jgi:hypothetical protein
MNPLIVSVGGFLALLVLLVVLRARFGQSFEVRSSDILLALIPVALWLFLTGKVKELAFGDLRIVSAVQQAATTSVQRNVSRLPIETIRIGLKGQLSDVETLRANKVQALGFNLHHGGYFGPAIREYLGALNENPSFRYLVIYNPDRTLHAVADGRQVAAMVRSGALDADQLAQWLNGGQVDRLASLPGYIQAKDALTNESDTRTALERMNALDVQTLPVVDATGQLAGVVDRSKLSASMLIEIADRVQQR